MWPVVLETVLFISSVAALAAAVVRCTQRRGWSRTAWVLLAIVWSWVVLGELVLNLMGSNELIIRWMRAVPARILTAVAFWLLVWHGRKERRRR
jgi:ABC-type molybdate transport system permease subunit